MTDPTTFNRGYGQSADLMIVGPPIAGGILTFALSAAYTYNSAGKAMGVPFVFESAGNITHVWINVASYGGTWASTDGKVQFEVRNSDSSVGRRPSTLIGSSNDLVLDGSTLGFVKFTLTTPVAVSAYTPYYLVLGDSDGGVTNFVTLNENQAQLTVQPTDTPMTTTNGWSGASAGTASGNAPLFACKQNGTMYGGSVFTGQATTSSDSLPVGNAFTFSQDVLVGGVSIPTDNGALAGNEIRIYGSTQLPGDVPLFKAVMATGFTTDFQRVVFAPYRLTANTKYYIVLQKAAGASTTPRIQSYPAGVDADLKLLGPLGGNVWRVIKTAAGTNTWTEDQTAVMNVCALIWPASQLGGLLALSGMTGGMPG